MKTFTQKTIIEINNRELENLLGYNLDCYGVSKSKNGTIINFDKVRKQDNLNELLDAIEATKVDDEFEDFTDYVLDCYREDVNKIVIKN